MRCSLCFNGHNAAITVRSVEEAPTEIRSHFIALRGADMKQMQLKQGLYYHLIDAILKTVATMLIEITTS
jgi:hypothetical protein